MAWTFAEYSKTLWQSIIGGFITGVVFVSYEIVYPHYMDHVFLGASIIALSSIIPIAVIYLLGFLIGKHIFKDQSSNETSSSG